MSDDNDWRNWFKDDDWWEDFFDLIRSFTRNPNPVTFEQLRGFVEEITKMLGEQEGRRMDLRALETVSRSHEVGSLPSASLFALVALAEQTRATDEKGSFGKVPIAQLSAIVRPKVGQLRVPDLVGLMKITLKVQKQQDVFERLTIDAVTDALSHSALRVLTLSELRSALEGLAATKLQNV